MKLALLYRYAMPNKVYQGMFLSTINQIIPNTEVGLVQLPEMGKKPKASEAREWLGYAQAQLNEYDFILFADADWFKIATKQSKAEGMLGIALKSPELSPPVFYCPSHTLYRFDQERAVEGLKRALNAISAYWSGSYKEIGADIIHSGNSPLTIPEISSVLNTLLNEATLTIDIEARGLKFTECGIWSISFSPDKHTYYSFPVDAIPEQSQEVRKLLKEFFLNFKGKKVIHKGNYDVTVLIYVLFMDEDITNIEGKYLGLDTFFNDLEDTLLLTYVATNSCSGNTLGLKDLAQPFAGNWAVDVTDVTKVPLDKLLVYNGIDTLSTFWVYEKYLALVKEEEQEEFYRNFYLPYLKDNINCQLTGMPIDMDEVLKLEKELLDEQSQLDTFLRSTTPIKNAEWVLAERVTAKRNKKLKTKVTEPKDNYAPINFGSTAQLGVLLYEVMALPVIELTDGGAPATGKDVLHALKNHTKNEEYLKILQALADLADVEKILSAFIPAFKASHKDKDGNYHLTGFLNLGGTVSGRLSSSDINLQNLPATGSRFAKPVKKCFKAPKGWVFAGIDFSSLEDYISALQTKDPNKLKVYIDGYDGHSLRARYYFDDDLGHIDISDVNAVNSIKKIGTYRQDSKGPTFALTYFGTAKTLVANCGFTLPVAQKIEANYHKMYQVSDEWNAKQFKLAAQQGYLIVALGLKVRTPLLKGQSYPFKSSAAQAQMRTVGNALGQGWGILNDRAMNEVMIKVRELGLEKDILPVSKIHDACYYLVKDDVDCVRILNDLTVKASRWQEHPAIQHDIVKLHGNLDLFYPDWAHPITLPDSITNTELFKLAEEHK